MHLEHPDITAALNTGYPSWNQPTEIFCEYCGRNITDDDEYFDENYSTLCEACLLDFHKKEW